MHIALDRGGVGYRVVHIIQYHVLWLDAAHQLWPLIKRQINKEVLGMELSPILLTPANTTAKLTGIVSSGRGLRIDPLLQLTLSMS